jgi:transcriptional regulator with XRE-family HTH domain
MMRAQDIIKSLRVAAKMTQGEVAEKIGTTKQTVFKYETGAITNIPLDKVAALATLFNVEPWEILGWDKPEGDAPVNRNTPEDDKIIDLLPMMTEDQKRLVRSVIEGFLSKK